MSLPTDKNLSDHWLQTFTGRQFHPYNPSPDEVFIEDIAHALSMLCRYAGHCHQFYSVAQHCVLVSERVAPEHALAGLLHDAPEAYLVDVPSPVKAGLPDYRALERLVEEAVFTRFGVPVEITPEIKHADWQVLATEARDIMHNPHTMWNLPVAPLRGLHIECWDPKQAEHEYLARYRELQA